MGDPGVDGLNGRVDNKVLPWRPTVSYRKVTGSGQRATARTTQPLPGQPWASPSTLDEVTCLSEDLSIVYVDPSGKEWTLSDMVIEVFKAVRGIK